MSPEDRRARRRWIAIVLVRLAGFAGAVFGLMLMVRATGFVPRLLGIAIVLSALFVIAIVPAALAHRCRSPG